MKLNNAVLSQSLPGYALPQYDRQAMARRSRQQPTWLHFGAGNLFRAFPAVLAQRLLNAGETDTGVLCCEAYDTDAVTQFLRPYDDLTLSVSLLADGSMEKEVVGSIAQSLTLPQDRCRVEEIFRAPSLQMVSFTITEKGYGKRTPVEEYRITNRGGLGIKNYMVTDKTGPVVGIKVVDGTEDLLLVTQAGILIRTPVESIRTAGRATQGVIVMRFKEEGDQVISMALTEHEEEEPSIEAAEP